MPSGRVHEASTVLLATTIATFAIREPLAWPVAFGAATACIVSADLDMSNTRAGNKWGIWKAFWKPYERAFPHRSASHIAVLGTLSRLVYLAILPATCLWLAGWTPPDWAGKVALLFVFGLSLADALHLVMDIADSWRKGRRWNGWHSKIRL